MRKLSSRSKTGSRERKTKVQERIADASPLPRAFFDRDPREVARDLLGKLLVRCHGNQLLAGRIVETEAYLGRDDPAAHAAAGRTPRNAVLWGPPGHAYVYLIYGNHYCLNVSCLPEGVAGCVLFRALEPVAGLTKMARARHLDPAAGRLLTAGPGRLAQALGITRPRDNDKDMTNPSASDLLILDDGFRPVEIAVTTRIGITKAAQEPLRYHIAGNQFVSGKRMKAPTD